MFITRRNPLHLFNQDEVPGGAQAPEVETPDTAANEAATQQQQEVDWAKRYSDLQPEYTRVTQRLSQAEQREQAYQALLYADDHATRLQAAEILGIEIEDDTPNDTQDLDPRLLQRLEAMEQRIAQRDSQVQQEQQLAEMEQYTEHAMDQLGLPQDDGVRDWIVSRAVALPPTPDGMPDVAAAHREFQALIDAQKKQWADTKRTHHISSIGQAGTQTPDWDTMTRAQRDEYMTEQIIARSEQ